MAESSEAPALVTRVMVATDRSESSGRAVRWAAQLARTNGAELVLAQVLLPPSGDAGEKALPEELHNHAATALKLFGDRVAGMTTRGIVVVDADPAGAIVELAQREAVDVLVVGNLGMSGRTKFLLGNIPNRISHNARCTVVIVNSGGATASGATSWRAPEAVDSPSSEGELLRRAFHIGRVFLRTGRRELLQRTGRESESASRERAARFREALDELGPTFAKLGQILSTRPDLLPPEFIDELATLQDRVTPLTEAEVISVMEQELGVPWEDVFASIEPTPLAAGTIAQVHRATLDGGERVVIKVQRPTAERDILQDVDLLQRFAAKTADRPAFRRAFDLPAMTEHLATSLRRELDFREEAKNIRRMHGVLDPYPRRDVPAVYEQYSTRRLLVMEEVQGVPVSQAPEGIARTEAARQLIESYYRQVLSEGFFHADPHPGNMKWWNDRLYLLDLGMIGELEPEVREMMLLLLLSFWQEDADFLAQLVLMLGGEKHTAQGFNMEAFRADLARVIQKYRAISLQEMQIGPMLQDVTTIAVRHNVRLPASLALTGKAFAQMQIAAAELDPTLDPLAVAGSFVFKYTVQQLGRGIAPGNLLLESRKARLRISRIFGAIETAMGATPGDRLQLDFGAERIGASVAVAARRLAIALAATGAIIGTAMTVSSPRVARWVPGLMGSLGAVLTAGLLADVTRRQK